MRAERRCRSAFCGAAALWWMAAWPLAASDVDAAAEQISTQGSSPDDPGAVDVDLTPRIDLNHASVEELSTLPGIGRKRAEAIIAFRTRVPFTRVTQLLNVKGIGRRTLERLRPHVTVTSVALDLTSSSSRRKKSSARPEKRAAPSKVSGLRPPSGCPPASLDAAASAPSVASGT